MPEEAGSVAGLWRYPVKSLRGETLVKAFAGPHGFAGDRGWALMAEGLGCVGPWASGKVEGRLMQASSRYESEPGAGELPPARMTLPDGTVVSTADDDAPERLSAWLGLPVTLRYTLSGEHFDAKPLHLVTTATLSALQALEPESRFDPRRFRPNILVSTERSGFPEQAWLGRKAKLGSAVLLFEKPTERCVMTTHAQADLPKDPGVMKAVVRHAKQVVGVYASVVEPGEVSLSDVLLLLP